MEGTKSSDQPDHISDLRAMGSAASHELPSHGDTRDTSMTDADDISRLSELPMERKSGDRARKSIKRSLEQESSGDDSEDEDAVDYQQKISSAKKSKKKARISEDQLVYIGHHAEEPRVGVTARIIRDAGRGGKIWTQAILRGGGPQFEEWSKYVSTNNQVKLTSIKLDATVIGDYVGRVEEMPRDKKIELIKNFVTSKKTQHQPGMEDQSILEESLVLENHHQSAPAYEPSRIDVGIHKDLGHTIYAVVIHRRTDNGPYVRFYSSGPKGNILSYADIEFDEQHWRGSFEKTKSYIKSLFKVKDVNKAQAQPRDLDDDSVTSQDDRMTPEMEDEEGSEDASESEWGENDDPAISSLYVAVRRVETKLSKNKVKISGQENKIDGLKSDLKEHEETITVLSTTKEEQARTIVKHEGTIRNHEETIKDLRQQNETSQSILRQRDQTIETLRTQARSLENGLSRMENGVDTASLKSEIEALKKKLEDQAQKLAASSNTPQPSTTHSNLYGGPAHNPEENKPSETIKLKTSTEEQTAEIQVLKDQLFEAQREIEKLRTPPLFPHPLYAKPLEFDGSRFQDAFFKVPDHLAPTASIHKEKAVHKFSENNITWQKTRMLQVGINIPGTPLNRTEAIGGFHYDCYEEGGKQKRVRLIDEKSLVMQDGRYCFVWEILKETEPEEMDYSF